MAGRDIEFEGAGRTEPDIVESAPRLPTPRRATLVAFALAVIVAAAGGYVAGQRNPRAPSASPAASPAASGPADALTGTGNRCSVQIGKRLQLGTEIANRSGATVTLHQVRARLPLGGLRAVARSWGSCGELPSGATAGAPALPPDARTWLTMTFDVLVPCPGPLPVQFTVDYTRAGRPGVADVAAFVDLGDVPYRGGDCRTD